MRVWFFALGWSLKLTSFSVEMLALVVAVALLGFAGVSAKIEPVILNGTCARLSFNWMELKSADASGLLCFIHRLSTN